MEAGNFKNTRRIILRQVLLVPFVAVMLVFGTLVYYFATNLSSQVGAKLTHIADGHRRLIEQFLSERCFDLQYAATSNRFEELRDNGRLASVFAQMQRQTRAFFDMGVFDEAGNHVAYVGPYDLKGKNYAQAEWFLQVREKGLYISDVFLGYRNIPHFVIAVRREEGDRTWYLRATIDTFFFDELVESIRVGKSGEAYLVNSQGIFQTRRRSGGELMDLDPDYSVYEVRENAIASFTADDRTGERHLYAMCRLGSTGWLLVVRQEVGDAYAPLVRAVLLAIAIIVAGGAVVVTMGFLLASGVANQLTVADMEKRRMGSQLIMAGKLAEVGEMSAGLAHEINNPLQVMKSEEALANDILDDMKAVGDSAHSENLQMLRDSINRMGAQIDRCKRITLGLLKFARESEPTIQMIDLQPFMREVVAMVERRAWVENIRIVEQFDDDLPRFESDPAQLQQVFLNLLNNAIDSLKGRNDGEIRITAARSDGNVAVSVADNGCGIAPEHIEKIFLPFFTTKPVGQGTGLGLSTCYGIVERLGGKITVSSEPNAGSIFTVRLPLDNFAEKAKSWLSTRERERGGAI
jgi:two-component system NtrC family sensor kinase